MYRGHTGDVSSFIQSVFDFTSDLYSLPRTYTVYMTQTRFMHVPASPRECNTLLLTKILQPTDKFAFN